jgi:hypothetical protein
MREIVRVVKRQPPPFRYALNEDLPDVLLKRTVHLAGTPRQFWAAAMTCPCGCGKRIELNLIPSVRPAWSASLHADGTVSLHPSVWRQKGCGSHFILRHGKVMWC